MNTSFVKSAPDGDFAEVTALIKGWEVQLHGLVNQKRAIWFDMYPMQGIPDEIKSTLSPELLTQPCGKCPLFASRRLLDREVQA